MTMTVLGGGILIALVAYEIVLPEYYGNAYLDKIKHVASSEKLTILELEKTTERNVFYDSALNNNTRRSDVQTIKQTIAKSRKSLEELRLASLALPELACSGYTPSYQKARFIKRKITALVDHGNQTLGNYENFMMQVYVFDDYIYTARQRIDDFNKIDDINVYAGQSADVRSIAATLASDANNIDALILPEEYQTNKQIAVDSFRRAASGFEDLAYGLDVALDAVIYKAVGDIEQAGSELDNIDESTTKQIGASRTLKDVSDLNEKIELLTQ